MSNFLDYAQQGAVVTLTMNAPEVRNALTNNSAVDEFEAACARINADKSVRVMILTGAGTVFSSGGNVKDMKRFTGDAVSSADIVKWYRTGIQRLPLALQKLEVPSIAAVNGAAIGLVSRVVEPEALLREAGALAARIARNPGSTLRMTKRLLREGQHQRLDSLLELSAALQSVAHKTPAHAEAVDAFIAKREPKFGDD